MGSTLGLQVKDTGSKPALVHSHSSCTCIDLFSQISSSVKFCLFVYESSREKRPLCRPQDLVLIHLENYQNFEKGETSDFQGKKKKLKKKNIDWGDRSHSKLKKKQT